MFLNRRTLLQTTASGFGYMAFSALAAQASAKDNKNPLAPKSPHFTPKAKHVIFLCMDGGPSHVDTFDYKPKLQSDDGKPYSRGRFNGAKLLGSPWKFKKSGQSGQMISELFPHLAQQADDLCILNGMHTDIPNHPQAFLQMHCGIFQFPRPSLGSWVLYGLGTENENLPGFITIAPPPTNGGPANYGASFLPAVYQGTKIAGNGPRQFGEDAKVANIENSKQSVFAQRQQLDFLQSLNRNALDQMGPNPNIEGLIESYELGFRMQAELPKVMDTKNESQETLKRYGIGEAETNVFGKQCLIARKMVEAGVRFVEVTKPAWDQHRNLKNDLAANCHAVDQPAAALIADLKARGLLKDTLVIWGGEFGRTPAAQGNDGRDHNSKGYSMWMAGGGVKGGLTYGKTDDYGFEAVEGKVHIHDWHATILALLGLDHEKLTCRYAGREMRLTDTKGTVVKAIMT
ncbi:DUF1501 domain-containing protein [Telmatocola sphagniphila]|uniref:DUF1501 domain-containing protein n=1 Tax=Telmatocola sphagniphila TaxID=1123043 RepID=A0A8E6B4A8_9BACT|nr:DUF1501 domain-containing protein [Telmatocola sphagniphila]QVL30861.1 DUF1501 domain-containing protein [Telmatocola sphagniphila]